MKTIKEKMWNRGRKIYDNFASGFGLIYVTPRTNALEMFSLLKDKKEEELLLREMMLEFLSNLSEEEIINKDGNLFLVSKKLTKF